MTALSKRLIPIFLLCFTLVGCSYEDTSKIRKLQNQLTECNAQAQSDRQTYYNAWENKSQDLDACLAANNNLYNFVDDKGTYLDKTAKFFTTSPWLSLLYGLVLLVTASAFSFFGIGFLLRWQHSAKHKEAEKTIKAAKEALQTQNKLNQTRGELYTLEIQKAIIIKELNELKQYKNIDELKEKAKIIAEAREEADRIFEHNMNKIKSQTADILAELDYERDKLNENWEELKQKELELEQIRQEMIEG